MFETVYAIVAKRAITKNSDNLKVLNSNPYFYEGNEVPKIFATRDAATTKLNKYYENIRDNYKVVRMELSFPDGYFKVFTNSDTLGGRGSNAIKGKFAHLSDAITVATGIDGWGKDASIDFVGENRETIFASVAEWKAYKKEKKAKASVKYYLRDRNGSLMMGNHDHTKTILEMITLT